MELSQMGQTWCQMAMKWTSDWLSLGALFKGIWGISAEDLDGLLKDLPVP